ncbi:hypothetical protein GX831_01610 [bacterium]|nr:hypothetical protein [bacterium]
MALHNDPVHNILRRVTPNVYYFHNRYDDSDKSNKLPYIVFQIVSKKPIVSDDTAELYKVEYQITVVTRKRNEALIVSFEQILKNRGFIPTLISSYPNDDYSINRVYKVEIISKGGY